MKRLLLILLITGCGVSVIAQKEKETDSETKSSGFKKEYLFSGGNVNISFFNGVTVLGASPQLGYSVAKWLDAGVIVGYTYTSQRDNFNNKFRQTIFAPGAFARLFPIDFLFASVQFEHNFVTQKEIPVSGGLYKYKTDVNSLLIGGGYSSGRAARNSPYYYFSVSVDILNQPNSPYTDRFNNLLPVIIAGFNIPLFQASRSRY